jgi:uncharacterized surface protein with fasciclin (FAS1) repeats
MRHHPTRLLVAALAFTALTAAACGDDSNEDANAEESMGDVLEVAAAEGDLDTFLAATEAAGIMDGLHGTGPFTVFIPTDEAFRAYLDETAMSQDDLFADPAALREVVEQHILNVDDDAEMVMAMDGEAFTTAAGTPLAVMVDGDTVMVGDATVVRYDLHASNGVIHVIDDVLVSMES